LNLSVTVTANKCNFSRYSIPIYFSKWWMNEAPTIPLPTPYGHFDFTEPKSMKVPGKIESLPKEDFMYSKI